MDDPFNTVANAESTGSKRMPKPTFASHTKLATQMLRSALGNATLGNGVWACILGQRGVGGHPRINMCHQGEVVRPYSKSRLRRRQIRGPQAQQKPRNGSNINLSGHHFSQLTTSAAILGHCGGHIICTPPIPPPSNHICNWGMQCWWIPSLRNNRELARLLGASNNQRTHGASGAPGPKKPCMPRHPNTFLIIHPPTPPPAAPLGPSDEAG
jgi:hypothetical protein